MTLSKWIRPQSTQTVLGMTLLCLTVMLSVPTAAADQVNDTRYRFNGDGTYTDTKHNLTWTLCGQYPSCQQESIG